MTTDTLMEKLRRANGALDRADYAAARWILFEAEELALRIQREMIDMQARVPAAVAPSYRTVANEIKGDHTLGWKQKLIALTLRGGRFAKLIFRHRHS